MFRFETLEIWKEANEYCHRIFIIVDKIPHKYQFSLNSQLRSAALSVSNNIAEGSGSDSKAEFKNFLNYSIRSLFEVTSMLFIVRSNKFIDEEEFKDLYAQSEKLVKRISAFKRFL